MQGNTNQYKVIMSKNSYTAFCFATFLCFLSLCKTSAAVDNCEYDMDLTKNIIKIVCEGSPANVNVYADTAHVSEIEDETQHKNDNDNANKYGPNNEKTKQANDNSKEKPTSGSYRPGNPNGEKYSKNTGPRFLQKDGNLTPNSFSGFDPLFSDFAWNATNQLKGAKRGLNHYSISIRNISSQLADGDENLRQDMENLRKTSNSATTLKEGIIAAMRNQYNFMRSALLTHNHELERMVTSLHTLVDITSEGISNALTSHKMIIDEVFRMNTTLRAVRRMVNSELKRRTKAARAARKKKPEAMCPKAISAIGSGSARQTDIKVGSYMIESINPNHPRTVWLVKGSKPSDQLLEFDASVDIEYNLVGRYFALPFFCEGTGHAIYRRHFYCHKADSNRIIKYHLKRMDIVSELELPGGGYGNKYPYRSGERSDVDLAVDELGLWAIYATDESAGKIVISKINHQHMEITNTWMTAYPKHLVGNAFMICGILYATQSHVDTPTYIRYMYNTQDGKDRLLEPGEIPFFNLATTALDPEEEAGTVGKGVAIDEADKREANSVMLTYEFRESKIHSWSNGRIESYPVYFKDFHSL